MYKVQINQAHYLNSSSDQTLLEAMEQAGLQPEFHCRDGHCGACKCTLQSGQVDYIGFALAFTNNDEVLPCISKAKTDVVLANVRYHKKQQRA